MTSEDDNGESSSFSSQDNVTPSRGRSRVLSRGRSRVRGRSRGISRGNCLGRRGSQRHLQLPQECVNITMKDNSYVSCFSSDDFCPLRDIGPHIPSDVDTNSPLCFFQLFFDDYVTQQILHSTLKYADSAKDRLKSSYNKFSKCPMTTEELFRFIGALILLGIHGVQNHRFAWSITKAQYMIRLNELLSCERFELIGTFLHLITPEEEESLSGCKLKKILPQSKVF